MSQTKVWTIADDTTTRIKSGTTNVGASHLSRLYVGQHAGYMYRSFLVPTLDWSQVGQIVSAIMTLYTDDGLGPLGDLIAPSDSPGLTLKRCTSAVGTPSDSATFVAGDYTAPSVTTQHQLNAYPANDFLGVTNIDITAIIEDLAPASVKRRDGTPGGGQTNRGFALYGPTDETKLSSFISIDADPLTYGAYVPYITLTFEYGATAPDAPTSLSPSGAVDSLGSFQGDFTDIRTTDKLRYSEVEVYTSAATNAGQTVTGGTRLYAVKQAESNTAVLNARFDHVAATFHPTAGVTYKWRARVYDNEGQVSPWTDLTILTVSNTDPSAPTLTPASGTSKATLDGLAFKGTFADVDAGDTLGAYEVQLSAYPEGDEHWFDDEFILWATGKRYVASGSTTFSTPYGGASLTAGTYYWRARVFDQRNGVSSWSYATLTLTADFIANPTDSTNSIQVRPRPRYRILIKSMGASRGPGTTVAVLEDALNIGASLLYNSPGEAHWTLAKNHPQISVIEPRQTHYAIEMRQGDGWREVFAGLVTDFDATSQDVVFYGIDYLGVLDASGLDEKYDPANPDRAAELGGSKYVTTGKNSIGFIIRDQLLRAQQIANSPTGFILPAQDNATLISMFPETMTVFSTYQPTLPFVAQLLDSHRAGTGKRSRISVEKSTSGAYQYVLTDSPGIQRDNLRLRYGELVQGYRVIPFGKNWATRVAGLGRDKDGVKVRYNSQTAPGIDETVWGRWVQPAFFDGLSDANDLARRVKQAVVALNKLGKQVAVGLRSGVLRPRDGYDLLDQFPLDIEDGSVSTSAFGSGYWTAVGITWTYDQKGADTTTLTLAPREDTVAPDSDLLTLQPISTQREWQVGWQAPNPLLATSTYWLDQTTGKVYRRGAGGTITLVATGTA